MGLTWGLIEEHPPYRLESCEGELMAFANLFAGLSGLPDWLLRVLPEGLPEGLPQYREAISEAADSNSLSLFTCSSFFT